MKYTIHKSIKINAPKEKVWNTLIDDVTYRQWTSVFSEGSHFETDWKEWSKALFKDWSWNWLISKIISHKPNESISVEHLWMIKDGIEIYDDPEINNWKWFIESYSVIEEDWVTTLSINQDITQEHLEFFSDVWDKALVKVKEIAEK